MALKDTPSKAQNIATFDSAGGPARLRYDVPLPGQYRGHRIVALDNLGLADADWQVLAADDDLIKQLNLQVAGATGGINYSFDTQLAIQYWFRQARANGVPGDKINELERFLASPEQGQRISLAQGTPTGISFTGSTSLSDIAGLRETLASRSIMFTPGQTRTIGLRGSQVGIPQGLTLDPSVLPPSPLPELIPLLKSYFDKFSLGVLEIPRPDSSGGTVTVDVPVKAQPKPQLALVEVYAVSSFLGDYGLGRTVKTMTLLPGEEMTMRIRTWRSSEMSTKESSSIFDSATVEAKDRFHSAVQRETTDKQTQTSQTEWHVEAEVGASWGWGSANVSGGGGGQYHSGREQFASQVNNATQEHAREASNKRDTSITSTTERIERREDEEIIERVIRNVNLRRVLSFVFRELNQTYDTCMHLVEVKIGYSDGTPNSWREVPLSGLRGLLEEVLQNKIDETAQEILNLISVVFDEQDNPHNVLEQFTWDAAANGWIPDRQPKRMVDGRWAPPQKDLYYRYRRGKIGQSDVEGVILRKTTVVLRTDSVLVEALLGEADALDEYAMVSQKADAEAKELANEQTSIVNAAMEKIDASELLRVYAEIVGKNGVVKLDLHQVP